MARGYHYEFLMVGLLIFLVTIPITDQFLGDTGDVVLRLGFVALLLFAVTSLRPMLRWFAYGAGLAAVAVVGNIVALAWPTTATTITAESLSVAFITLVVVVALKDVLFRGPVDAHKIVGAVCIYLLSGVVWMLLYNLAETIAPGSFKGIESTLGQERAMELLYYSFVTLSTLGYGDISPVGPLTRGLAWSEAVFGQLYLTILVAALVGMHLSARQADRGGPEGVHAHKDR